MRRSHGSNGRRRADTADLLAIMLLTLVYVACVLILDGNVVLPLG